MALPKFIANDDSQKNTYGFFIKSDGGKFDRFNANPVMLANHINSPETTIGYWENLSVADGKITLEPVFDTEHEKGKVIAGQVERKFLKACSMGILPNWDKLERVGEAYFLMEWELVEVSIVAVPSNRGAVAVYSADGKILSENEVKELCLSAFNEVDQKPVNPQNHNNPMKKIMLSVASLMAFGLEPKNYPEGVEESELESKIQKLHADLANVTKERDTLKLAADEAARKELEQKKSRVETAVTLAITQGKIKADQKQDYIDLGLANESILNTTLSNLQGKKDLGAGVQVPGDDPGAGSAVKTLDDFMKLSLDKQKEFVEQHPEEYKKITLN